LQVWIAIDLCGCGDGDLKAYGHRIRHTVKQWTGIPVSIGIGATKTLAKLANRLAKRSDTAQGVFDLTVPQHQDDVLQSTLVKDIEEKRIPVHQNATPENRESS
jgi:DNA polymerase V